MSLETLRFLLFLLNQQQIQVGHPTFDEMASAVLAAKRELADAIADAEREIATS